MVGIVDLTGIYRAEGRFRANGAPYGSEVTITQLGEVYQLQWRSGLHVWAGNGIVQGNVLAVALFGSTGNGVVAYEILPQPNQGLMLHGVWAYANETEVSTEVLVRIKNPNEVHRRGFPGNTDFMSN